MQRGLHLEDHVQTLGENLATLPQNWNQRLGLLVAQLQRIISDETSSDAQVSLQQQLIASLERLEGRLDESRKG